MGGLPILPTRMRFSFCLRWHYITISNDPFFEIGEIRLLFREVMGTSVCRGPKLPMASREKSDLSPLTAGTQSRVVAPDFISGGKERPM